MRKRSRARSSSTASVASQERASAWVAASPGHQPNPLSPEARPIELPGAGRGGQRRRMMRRVAPSHDAASSAVADGGCERRNAYSRSAAEPGCTRLRSTRIFPCTAAGGRRSVARDCVSDGQSRTTPRPDRASVRDCTRGRPRNAGNPPHRHDSLTNDAEGQPEQRAVRHGASSQGPVP
jgi:hypothetical protein